MYIGYMDMCYRALYILDCPFSWGQDMVFAYSYSEGFVVAKCLRHGIKQVKVLEEQLSYTC